jgi:hypothetical protein
VAIPLAAFLKDFANDEAKLELVRPFIKTTEGLSTKQELEEDNDGEYIKALLAKAAEATETKTAADEIYERITAQLVGTGRQSAATARQSAAIVTAQVTTQYEYLKSIGFKKEDGTEVTLEELFADFGLEIVGPEVDVGAADFMTQEEQDEMEALAPHPKLDPAEFRIERVTETTMGGQPRTTWELYRGDELVHFSATKREAQQAIDYAAAGKIEIRGDLEMAMHNYDIVAEDIEFERIRAENAGRPRVLKQQKFSTIDLVEARIDEAGNTLAITENAGVLWQEQQVRQDNINKLRSCLRA